MNIEQATFERIVGDAAALLDAKHAHVKTVTSGGKPVPFRIGLATVGDALSQAPEANGISVGSAFDLKWAGDFLKQHQDRLGVTVEVGEDAIHIKRVGLVDDRHIFEAGSSKARYRSTITTFTIPRRRFLTDHQNDIYGLSTEGREVYGGAPLSR
ncbi:hypothetical protein [Paraburkholderia sp.]|uniref:hypothetical protein n=1 Tax=Paraburkholderia sp. TaxID=1926495 RepID=UPI003C7CA3F5